MIISKNGLKYVETMKPLEIKPVRFIAFNYEILATLLSVASYSLIVTKHYSIGYLLGIIGSIMLGYIMYKKDSLPLMGLYIFFLLANTVGYITS